MDRSSRPALVLAAVFLLSAFASVPSPGAAQAPVGTSSLAGLVCSIDQNVVYIKAPDAGDPAGCGTYLAGATLRLVKAGVGGTIVGAVDKTATSDGNGSYQFSTLPDGAYTLSVTRTGYQAASVNLTVSGATSRDVGLRPAPITVTGKVVDTAGAPIGYARVVACCGPTSGASDAMTDAGGAFTLKTEAGQRTLTVEKDGRTVHAEERFLDGSQPITLTVPPPPRPDATLRGTVKDQDGKPLAGIAVSVYSHGGCCYETPMPATASSSGGSSSASYIRPYHSGGSNSTTTDAAGRYAMRVFGGAGLSVSVYLDGYANYNKYVEVPQGGDRTLDIQLLKYPAKTAHIEGKVIDAATGKPLRHVSISVQSPAYGLYECSQEPASTGTPPPKAMPAEDARDDSASMAMAPSYQDNACAITIGADGTFRGNVTPGYAILQAYHDSWRACPESATSSVDHPCLPEYYTWTQSIRLAAGGTTALTIAMQQRPAPDAVVSGYLLDDATGKPIAGAQVSFSNEDAHGYGAATTDQDGSYRIRLRSGHLMVYAHAEGHLHWQGTLDAKPGETPFDIRMAAGEEANGGGCCIAYAEKGTTMEASATPAMGGNAAMASSDSRSSASFAGFEDLKGGLGPYDAEARARTLKDASGGQSSPGVGALLLVSLLGCAAWLRRR